MILVESETALMPKGLRNLPGFCLLERSFYLTSLKSGPQFWQYESGQTQTAAAARERGGVTYTGRVGRATSHFGSTDVSAHRSLLNVAAKFAV
jgi:hypothetical protein